MKERDKRYVANRRQKGSTQIAVWIDPDEQAMLNDLADSAESKSDAVRGAIRKAWELRPSSGVQDP